MTMLLLIHIAVTWALCGLILTIQFVHYPLFESVGSESFHRYHQLHLKFISRIVAPLMFTEVATAGIWLIWGDRDPLFLWSLAGIAVVWLSTAFMQIPLHNQLAQGYDATLVQKLARTNAWRTFGWIFRGVCLTAMLHSILANS